MQQYTIKGYSNYYLTEDSKIFSKRSGKEMTQRTSHGYSAVSLVRDDGQRKHVTVHRIVALNRLERPKDLKWVEVNHKDGIKSNNHWTNLEFCTRSENMLHAMRMNLRGGAIAFQVRDTRTGEVREFPSVFSGKKELGLTKDQVDYRLEAGPTRVFPDFLQYRHYNGAAPWPDVNVEKSLRDFGMIKQVHARDLIDGEAKIFNSQEEACAFLGYKPAFLSALLDEGQPVVKGRYQIKRDIDEEWETPDYTARGHTFVKVTDTKTGKVEYYKKAADAARACNLLKTTLNWRLNKNGKMTYPDGKIYERHNGPVA